MSKTLATVGLNGAKFNAAIGWFPEERVFKNDFVVDLSAMFEADKPFTANGLNESIDYMQLHEICSHVFKQEAKLIEVVAQEIINKIVEKFPKIQEITLNIKKLNPPVKAQIASSFVQLTYKKTT